MDSFIWLILLSQICAQSCPQFPSGSHPRQGLNEIISQIQNSLTNTGQFPHSLIHWDQPDMSMPLFREIFTLTAEANRSIFVGVALAEIAGKLQLLKYVMSPDKNEVLKFLNLLENTKTEELCMGEAPMPQFMQSAIVSEKETAAFPGPIQAPLPQPPNSFPKLLLGSPSPNSVSFSSGEPPKAVSFSSEAAPVLSQVMPMLQSPPMAQTQMTHTIQTTTISSNISNLDKDLLQKKLSIKSIEDLENMIRGRKGPTPEYRYIRKKQIKIGGILSGTGIDKIMNPTLERVN